MARISGVNIPTNKKINIALTYIFGIGPKRASNICIKASENQSKRVNQLRNWNIKSLPLGGSITYKASFPLNKIGLLKMQAIGLSGEICLVLLGIFIIQ